MWVIKIDTKKKVKEFRKKIKSLYEKNLSTNKNNNNGKRGSNQNNN